MRALTFWRVVRTFVADDRGQDLMEYVLLSAFIGLAGLAALNALGVRIHDWYGLTNSNINQLSTSPDPGAGT